MIKILDKVLGWIGLARLSQLQAEQDQANELLHALIRVRKEFSALFDKNNELWAKMTTYRADALKWRNRIEKERVRQNAKRNAGKGEV